LYRITKKELREDYDKLEEKVWEIEAQINSLCELLGIAFNRNHAKFVQKEDKKK
jgi:hypothetical protein